MNKAFYLRLAVQNMRRNKAVFLPQLIATAVIGGVFFLINGMVYSEGLKNVPSGDTASIVFTFGTVLFALFAFFFLFYINSFLIKRRKKEFGLYAVLGLSKRQIARVLVYENLFSMGIGLVLGIVFALAFGKLLFMLLLTMIRAVGDSTFVIGAQAYVVTLVLFLAVFLVNTIFDVISVRLANPVELLHSEKKGDKDSKLLIPGAILGLVLLIGSYYFSWTISNSGIALGVFFPLAMLVILATYLLFQAGSVVLLKALRKNKKFYYQTEHFVTVSGLIHRMKQNARGLASICILSTMLVVTVSGTVSLYIGQEEALNSIYPYACEVYKTPIASLEETSKTLDALAADYGVQLSADESKLITADETMKDDYGQYMNNMIPQSDTATKLGNVIVHQFADDAETATLVFDANGDDATCLEFINAAREAIPNKHISNVFDARQNGYGLYGGLLFLGAFFGLLFLSITVLIIYFKQVTEGYEDKERFAILQKVGMDQAQVKHTINRQVLFVFFAPLMMTLLHMIFASRIMTQMLRSFRLCNWGLVLACIGAVCVLFILLYYVVYRLTARTYYKIVRRD